MQQEDTDNRRPYWRGVFANVVLQAKSQCLGLVQGPRSGVRTQCSGTCRLQPLCNCGGGLKYWLVVSVAFDQLAPPLGQLITPGYVECFLGFAVRDV